MTKLNGEASVLQLLQEMTVREKIDLLTGASNFSSLEMKKYGIPSIRYLDGATGVNLLQYVCELAGMLAGQTDTEKADMDSPDTGTPAPTGRWSALPGMITRRRWSSPVF